MRQILRRAPVIDFPDLPALTAALTDRRFAAALAVAALSGFVRGFSGFGSALIYIPLIAAIYEPRIAAPTLLLIDLAGSVPFTIRELERCNWREVGPVTTAAALAVPLGTMALLWIDPIVLRWFIAVLVLGLLAVLASGWRYHGKPTLPVSIGVGLFAGFGSGAVQIAGPAVIIFWLGGASNAVTVRANLMVFFMLMGFITGVAYATQGIITSDILALSVLLGDSLRPCDVGRRALVPRRLGERLPPRRLRDHRRGRARQHAAVGWMATLSPSPRS